MRVYLGAVNKSTVCGNGGVGAGTNLLTLSPLPDFNFNVVNLKLGHRANNQIKYALNLPNRQTNSPKKGVR